MRIMVTGGTGYVGSHSVKALMDHGHEVRLLVRSRKKIDAALKPLGIGSVESFEGDVLDEKSVRAAMEGCDAVLHAASVYSLDSRDSARMLEVNARAADLVIASARRHRLDPIVYVSSFVALLPPSGILTAQSPVGSPAGVYSRSKADAERAARKHAAEGAPIVTVYPGAVWGPHDPHLGDQLTRLINILHRRLPIIPAGGFPIVDVRDLALVHAKVMEPGRGPRRYLAAGHFLQMRDAIRLISETTGRKIPAMVLPSSLLKPFGRLADALQKLAPFRLPLEYEGIYIAACNARCDDSETRSGLGLEWRDLRGTVTDSIRWLLEKGCISPRTAGRVATIA